MGAYEKRADGKFYLKPAPPPDTTAEAALVEDAVFRALVRASQPQPNALEAAKAKLSAAGAEIDFSEVPPARDWDPDEWAQPDEEPLDGLLPVLERLGMLK